MEQFIHQNGYLLVFVTIAFTGEFGLFTGVALARTGSVTLWGVIALGTAASFVGNVLYYYAGRVVWNKWSFVRKRFGEKVEQSAAPVRKFGSPLMLVARYFYGIREVVPVALGLYQVRTASFMVYNLVGAFIWSWSFTEAANLLSVKIVSSFTTPQSDIVMGIAASIALAVAYFTIRKVVARLRRRWQ